MQVLFLSFLSPGIGMYTLTTLLHCPRSTRYATLPSVAPPYRQSSNFNPVKALLMAMEMTVMV